MPEERIYQSRVGVGGPQRAVLSDARDFGAGIGAAIEQAGSVAHQLQIRDYRLDRQEKADSEAADFTKRFTQLRTDTDAAIREARANHGPGAQGHAKAMLERVEKQREALLGTITEKSVRRSAEAQFGEYVSRLSKVEGDFEEGKRVDKLVTDIGDSIDISRNRVRIGKGDAETYAEELTLTVAAIDAMPGTSDDIKEKLVKQAEQGLSVSFLQGMMDSDPAKAKAAIDAGQFNDMLSPEQLEALRNGADVEIRRIEAEEAEKVRAAEVKLNQRLRELKEYDSQGVEIPDAALAEMEAAYTAIGKTDLVVEIQGMRANSEFARVWEKRTPVQREQRLAELRAKAKPTVAEQREIAWHEKHSGPLDSKWNDDPFAAIQAAGFDPAPPLDMNDPQSVRDRIAWQRSAAAFTERPIPLFSKNELAGLQEQYRAGEKEQVRLLAALDVVPAAGGSRVEAARQIAPDDQHFQILAQLNANSRAMVVEGRKVLRDKGARTFWAFKDNPDAGEMAAQINADLERALKRVPGAVGPIRDTAIQYATGALARNATDADDLTRRTYLQAMRVALGGKDGTGGLSYWNGRPYVVADGFTPEGFEAAIVRDIRRKADNPPVNPDGSAAQLSRAVPVFIGPGRYQWETPGGQLVLAKNGQPYVSEVVAGR